MNGTRFLRQWMGFSLFISIALPLAAQEMREFKDVVYASVDGKPLALDLYVPKASAPLIVWIHGGAWHLYDKEQYPKALVDAGFALASLDFRQSTDARFPAQIHDIKAGIRFLRANAKRYGYRVDCIAIAGASSGGHLAALVGVTNGSREHESTLGEYLNVQCASHRELPRREQSHHHPRAIDALRTQCSQAGSR